MIRDPLYEVGESLYMEKTWWCNDSKAGMRYINHQYPSIPIAHYAQANRSSRTDWFRTLRGPGIPPNWLIAWLSAQAFCSRTGTSWRLSPAQRLGGVNSHPRNWSNMIFWTLDWRHFPISSFRCYLCYTLLYMICIYYTCDIHWYSLINHDPMHPPPRSIEAPLSSQQLWPPLAAKGALDPSDGACPDLSSRFLLTFQYISHIFTHLHTSPKLDKVGRFI